jgi:hypothetical protein
MTTEFPSGDTLTSGKLTELKNSSRVSVGFAFCASAKIGWVEGKIKIKDRSSAGIDRRIDLSLTIFGIMMYTLRV